MTSIMREHRHTLDYNTVAEAHRLDRSRVAGAGHAAARERGRTVLVPHQELVSLPKVAPLLATGGKGVDEYESSSLRGSSASRGKRGSMKTLKPQTLNFP